MCGVAANDCGPICHLPPFSNVSGGPLFILTNHAATRIVGHPSRPFSRHNPFFLLFVPPGKFSLHEIINAHGGQASVLRGPATVRLNHEKGNSNSRRRDQALSNVAT